MKKVFSLLLFLIIIFSLFTSCGNNEIVNDANNFTVVTTIFPYYDFVREVAGDKAEITMLISPGAESHDYEPSPQDIIKINQCDLFIYNGGESDEWVHSILDSLDENVKVLRMFDYVTPLCTDDEYHIHHHNDENFEHKNDAGNYHSDFDEHIWTSPVNAIKLSKAISEEIINIDYKNSDLYQNNCDIFVRKLSEIHNRINNIVNKGNKNTLVIADRFPMLYFTEEYHIKYKSAFSGCSSETQPSIATVTDIIDFTNDNNIPVVFHIDNSNTNFANLICEDTGAKLGTLYSCHNVTKEQFDKGETYISLMNQNAEILKEAL